VRVSVEFLVVYSRKSTLAVVAAAIAGCGGGASPPSPPARTATASPAARTATPSATPSPPALCRELKMRKVGRVRVPGAAELSGLALSRSGTLWTHNDSGDGPRLLALDERGRFQHEVTLVDAEAVDWEDVAVRGGTIYVGDIGDNALQRPSVTVYKLPEPARGVTSVAAQRIDLRYRDGAHDAETLLIDPKTQAIVVVTKELGGRAGVYQAVDGVLRKRAELDFGIGEPLTAGDVSQDGRTIVLRSYDRAWVFERRRGESLVAALERDPCTAGADLLGEGQGEALALSRDGRAFYTVPEGPDPVLRAYVAP
jgi:hypothetical protein